MSDPYEYQQVQARQGPSEPWMVHLLLGGARLPDRAAVHGALGAHGRVAPMDGTGLSVSWTDHRSDVDGRLIPVAHSVEPGALDPASLATALPQAWNWPEAREAVRRVTSGLWIVDGFAGALPRASRLALLGHTVRCLVERTDCLAIYWRSSDRLVEPSRFLASRPGLGLVAAAAVNVRMYSPEGIVPEETVMDTLGMAAFGLPDLQCHFAGLDTDRVAARLFGYATYLFDRGDVLDDGDLLEGSGPEGAWTTRRERALFPPERAVVDLDPGPMFNARDAD
jgi:Domain of unknown function (DUF4261)